MKTHLVLSVLLITTGAFAQNPISSENTKAQPIGGKGELQIIYYKIDFTPEETQYLRTHSAELIFSVSESGIARLEKVNDIEMPSIVSKMMAVSDQLPAFQPERVNGRREAGVYFLHLAWPNYQGQTALTSPYPLQVYYPVIRKVSEFSEITYRGPRFDMLLGVFATSFNGNIGRNVGKGWGTKFDFIAYGKKGWGGGFGTTMIITKAAMNDPSQPIRLQNRSHIISLFYGSFGKIFNERTGGQFGVQFEPGFGITDIIDRDQSDKVIGLGFIPGVSVAYMLPLGQGRMVRQYFMPIVYQHYLSFHVSARQMMMNVADAKGTVYEFGLSYRFAQRPVASYKLKDENRN